MHQHQPLWCRQAAYRRRRRPPVPQLQLVLPIRKTAYSKGLQAVPLIPHVPVQPATRISPERTSFELPIRTSATLTRPANSAISSATVMNALPFSDNGNVSGARRRDNDPTVPRAVTEVPAGILDQMARISALPAACQSIRNASRIAVSDSVLSGDMRHAMVVAAVAACRNLSALPAALAQNPASLGEVTEHHSSRAVKVRPDGGSPLISRCLASAALNVRQRL